MAKIENLIRVIVVDCQLDVEAAEALPVLARALKVRLVHVEAEIHVCECVRAEVRRAVSPAIVERALAVVRSAARVVRGGAFADVVDALWLELVVVLVRAIGAVCKAQRVVPVARVVLTKKEMCEGGAWRVS